MNHEWTLREEILRVSHFWPYPLLAFLIGCALGVAFAYLVPAPYRAETVLSVAYNADAYPRNPDDYKNWQMNQLEELALAPDVLEAALAALRGGDPVWESVSVGDLQRSLDVSWRTTGAWRFSASGRNSEEAAEAVQAWTEALLQEYGRAIGRARDLIDLDQRLYHLNATAVDVFTRWQQVSSARELATNWRAARAGEDPLAPLPALESWQLASIVTRPAVLDPAWKALLGEFPAPESPLQAYLDWHDRFEALSTAELSVLDAQALALQPEQEAARAGYDQAAEESRGLSAYLSVERPQAAPRVSRPRAAAQAALVGGLAGLVAWIAAWLASRMRRREA